MIRDFLSICLPLICSSSEQLPWSIENADPVAVQHTAQEVFWLAATVYEEARGEGEIGMRAVAHVVDNRMKHGNYGGYEVGDVVFYRLQFSPWNNGFRPPTIRNAAQSQAWETALRVSREVLTDQSTDPTRCALYFHATYVKPKWSVGARGRTKIGNHIFYCQAGGRPIPAVPRLPSVAPLDDIEESPIVTDEFEMAAMETITQMALLEEPKRQRRYRV